MKKLIFFITIILCLCAVTLRAADIDFGDLKHYEKADPHVDVSSSIAKGDLRFIALQGYSTYIPGVDDYFEKYSSYGYKVIKGTSDVIQSYEHGRLIQIAQYYAKNYNQELLKYIEALKARKIAESTEGYANAKRIFKIEEVTIGNINMLPYSLHAVLSLNNTSCVNDAWWFDPLTNDKPEYDWNQFLEIFSKIDQAVCQQGWIKDWIESGKNRTAEAQVFGVRPYTETDFHDSVEIPWDKAKLKSKPYYEILLREDSKWVGTLYISEDNNTTMITNLNGAKGNHWLDDKKLCYHPSSPSVIVVNKSGNWRMVE